MYLDTLKANADRKTSTPNAAQSDLRRDATRHGTASRAQGRAHALLPLLQHGGLRLRQRLDEVVEGALRAEDVLGAQYEELWQAGRGPRPG